MVLRSGTHCSWGRVLSAGVADQGDFGPPAQRLDRSLALQGQALARLRFVVDQRQWPAAACIPRGRALVVLPAATLKVFSDAGVERSVRTAQQVDEPDIFLAAVHLRPSPWAPGRQ